MTWHKHIDYVTAKASQKIGQMYRSAIYLDRQKLSSVYLTMIRPILEYGSILFDNCTAGDSMRLEKIQRRAALICTGAMRRTESSKLLTLLGWPSLESRRKLNKLLMFFKIAKNLTPLYLSENVQCKLHPPHTLRGYTKLIEFNIPRTRLTCYQNSFFPSVIKEWNALPEDITNSTSINMFKVHLMQYHKYKIKINVCPMFDASYGYYGKLLTQMMLGVSKLNYHLFVYNITDNPFCPKCFDSVENNNHFFFECVAYSNFRVEMMDSIMTLLHKYNIVVNTNSDDNINDIIFNGLTLDKIKHEQFSINRQLFDIVKWYVKSTCRFCKI